MLSRDVRRIALKELLQFFSSPVAYLFLASFLAVTLFIFFWVEAFFARNIADVRPMFEWMPVLLIFLSAALTMRMWSEEKRTGTMEYVATLPVSISTFVLGKFMACWILLGIALLLTLVLPLGVTLISELDWGPVFAGYLATILLGAAYLSIGLCVSARTDSQIVCLIFTCLGCGVFYLVGSPLMVDLFGQNTGEMLQLLGTGARFESITRGVLDSRDLYYYFSIAACFLVLNVYALESQRWTKTRIQTVAANPHRKWQLATGLVVLNILLVHAWLFLANPVRVDVTEEKMYSISTATRNYLAQLDEPLLVRGYFSTKTHPLLAPLVPQMKNLLAEISVAGGKKVRVEIIDPAEFPELEEEANRKYGIQPVPFQIPGRYQTSLVNSYFDIVLQYGDQYETLGFRDLIEVKMRGETDIDVQLRNPEFHLARSLKQVIYSFQAGGEVFANIVDKLTFTAFVSSPETLPVPLVEFSGIVEQVLAGFKEQAGDKLVVAFVDPSAGDGSGVQLIADKYGFTPMAADLLDTTGFYFYLVLESENSVVQIPLAEDLSAQTLEHDIETALKRFARGYLKTVALFAPQYDSNRQEPQASQYLQLADALRSDFDLLATQLQDGRVPGDAELLLVVDPKEINELQLFAIDQFLMQGGTVVLSVGSFETRFSADALAVAPRSTGLEDWLKMQGVQIKSSLVMDPQNAAFPVPVMREAGGFSFRDYQMLDYPYFVDVRSDGLSKDSPITAYLPQITMPWVSPIEIENETLAITELIRSSPGSWLSESTDVLPKVSASGQSGFAPQGEQGRSLLGVLLEGRFQSGFRGKVSPLLKAGELADGSEAKLKTLEKPGDQKTASYTSVIEQSPDSARLLVFSSNEFLSDQMLGTLGSASGTLYLSSIDMMLNTLEWSLEDQQLLSIRSRGNFNRTLPPDLVAESQMIFEYIIYILALLSVGGVFLAYKLIDRQRIRTQAHWLAEGQA